MYKIAENSAVQLKCLYYDKKEIISFFRNVLKFFENVIGEHDVL